MFFYSIVVCCHLVLCCNKISAQFSQSGRNTDLYRERYCTWKQGQYHFSVYNVKWWALGLERRTLKEHTLHLKVSPKQFTQCCLSMPEKALSILKYSEVVLYHTHVVCGMLRRSRADACMPARWACYPQCTFCYFNPFFVHRVYFVTWSINSPVFITLTSRRGRQNPLTPAWMCCRISKDGASFIITLNVRHLVLGAHSVWNSLTFSNNKTLQMAAGKWRSSSIRTLQ